MPFKRIANRKYLPPKDVQQQALLKLEGERCEVSDTQAQPLGAGTSEWAEHLPSNYTNPTAQG